MATKENVVAISKALYFIQKARVACQVRETHLLRREVTKQLTEKLGREPDEDEFDSEWKASKKEEKYIPDPLVHAAVKSIFNLEKELNEMVEDVVRTHPAYSWFSKIKGIGDLNIGKVTCLIDIEKVPQLSQLWRFALGAPINGKVERKEKGKMLHYNQVLKSMCWRLGKSLIRANGKYAQYYRMEKLRLTTRLQTEGKIIVPSNKLPIVDGKHIEKDGYFGLGHVDTMAMRRMIKLFLSHLWLKWRQAERLPITQPYVQAIMGHQNIIAPEEMFEDEEPEQIVHTKERRDDFLTTPQPAGMPMKSSKARKVKKPAPKKRAIPEKKPKASKRAITSKKSKQSERAI